MATETTKTEVGSYFIANYPPFSQWTAEARGRRPQRALDVAAGRACRWGLYLHIPFCRKRCKFCYFRVYTDKNAGDVERYVAALSREIELVSRLPVMGGRPFRFVYFGGGTPSFLSAKQLTSLVDRLRANINWDQAEEVTFECEPGTLSQPKVAHAQASWASRGSAWASRISATPCSKKTAGPICRAKSTKRGTGSRPLGFPNINIDLIAGMVGETWDNWRDCVAPHDRARAGQRDDLPDGAAVQHGLFERHPGQPRSRRRWPTGRPSGPGSITPSTSWRRPATRCRAPTRWCKDKTQGELQLSRQPVARQRSAGHRRGQLRPRLGRALSEPARLGRLRRPRWSGASCRCRAACGPRRISCWCAR